MRVHRVAYFPRLLAHLKYLLMTAYNEMAKFPASAVLPCRGAALMRASRRDSRLCDGVTMLLRLRHQRGTRSLEMPASTDPTLLIVAILRTPVVVESLGPDEGRSGR